MSKRGVLLAALGLAIIFAGGILLGVFLPPAIGFVPTPGTYLRASILRRVKALSNLATLQYVMEKVVILEDVKWFGETRVLMLAQGIVKAGVDLSRLDPGVLEIPGKTIRIKLPPPQI